KAAKAAKKAEQIAQELDSVVSKVDNLASKTAKGAAEATELAPGALGHLKNPAPAGDAAKILTEGGAIAKLKEVVSTQDATKFSSEADAAAAAGVKDFTATPDKFYLPKTLRDARLPKGMKSTLRTMFGSSDEIANERLLRDYEKSFADVGLPAIVKKGRFQEE